jgi:hypothetical protein
MFEHHCHHISYVDTFLQQLSDQALCTMRLVRSGEVIFTVSDHGCWNECSLTVPKTGTQQGRELTIAKASCTTSTHFMHCLPSTPARPTILILWLCERTCRCPSVGGCSHNMTQQPDQGETNWNSPLPQLVHSRINTDKSNYAIKKIARDERRQG